MALRDFKIYLHTVQNQVLAAKEDLADFEKALSDGYITEDKLQSVKDEYAELDVNYQRLLYVGYLLELPSNKKKKAKYKNNTANKELEAYFENENATDDDVINEDESVLTNLRRTLKDLKKNSNTK